MSQNFTTNELAMTIEDLLIRRMIASIATNTDMLDLLKQSDKMNFVEGEPPSSKEFQIPCCYVWIPRDRTVINAQGSQQFKQLTVNVFFSLKAAITYKPYDLNTDGTFKIPIPDEKTALREAYAIKKILSYVLENDGYDNKWYYTFVSEGVLGEAGNIEFNLRQFGGGDTGCPIQQRLAFTFQVKTWQDVSLQLATGPISITVTHLGNAVSGATVYIKDAKGNYVWDSSGNYKWTTNGSGIATATGLLAQKGCTVYAEKSGVGSNSSANQTIPNTSTLSVSIAI